MRDEATTVAQLRQVVAEFVAARDWQQFHAPKNISMALAIEAAELMEHFQWISVDESREVAEHSDKLAAVGEELADVLCYVLALANELDLDLAETLEAKMVKNVQKYPADEYQGRYGPEDDR
jgi:NTP pyrophosphatase (non-canonical NTP hydrolase)